MRGCLRRGEKGPPKLPDVFANQVSADQNCARKAAIVTWPKLLAVLDNYSCQPGDSMLVCNAKGGTGAVGNLGRFLTAAGGAYRMQWYSVIVVVSAVLMSGFQCFAVR